MRRLQLEGFLERRPRVRTDDSVDLKAVIRLELLTPGASQSSTQMTGDRSFISMLAGGRRQSIGESDAVAQQVRSQPDLAGELWEAIAFPDPLVHMRAVDALEKVSASRPEVLVGHEQEILEDLTASKLAEVRWHVGLMIPRLQLDARRVSVAVAVLERLLTDRSRIVQANALEGIVRLADAHPELAHLADAAISTASQSPHASVRARARRLTR